jgi:hypothetical protein
MDINTLSLTPSSGDEPAADLFAGEQAVAMAEARRHVFVEATILALLAAVARVAEFDDVRVHASRLQAFLVIGAIMLRDVHWWLWLRSAEPREAYRRLQQRPANADLRRIGAYTLIAITCIPWVMWVFRLSAE